MSITLLRHAGKVVIAPRHIVGILLVIAMAALSFQSCSLGNKIARVEKQYMQASGNASAYQAHSQGVRTVYQERTNAQDEAEAVLEANPQWSGSPLPPDVADLLRHDTNASRAVP